MAFWVHTTTTQVAQVQHSKRVTDEFKILLDYPDGDRHLTSPKSSTSESNFRVMKIEKMIMNS